MGTKIKRGTELSLNGALVWCNLDQGGDCVFICHQKRMDVTKGDVFEWIPRDDLKPVKEVRAPIKKLAKNLSDEEIQNRANSNDFFDQMALKIPYYCENCGKPLYAFNKKAKRSVTAHILPKKIFKSIAIDPNNILFMGADYIGCPCNCHDRWDMNSDIRSKMPIYDMALGRFETDLKFKLTRTELKAAYTYLKIEWK